MSFGGHFNVEVGVPAEPIEWYRSWPEHVPAGRAHVVDGLPRLVMRDCNYATVPDYQPWPQHQPGWCMLEWDIALDAADRQRFVDNAMKNPDRVRVAPYTLFYDGGKQRQCQRWGGKPIVESQPRADMVGLGCIYFPQGVLDRLWSDPPKRLVRTGVLTDTVFSDWHRQRFDWFDVDWSVRPQHLHGD